MKIQDLRDDLAEMRYFKKSYLRKMQNETSASIGGGPELPMPPDGGAPSGKYPWWMQDDYFYHPYQKPDGNKFSEPVEIDSPYGYDSWDDAAADILRRLSGTMM